MVLLLFLLAYIFSIGPVENNFQYVLRVLIRTLIRSHTVSQLHYCVGYNRSATKTFHYLAQRDARNEDIEAQ
jgi:hypothetical protein